MSKVSELIFHKAEHKLSSPFGARAVISTAAGKTSPAHNGCDYSTGGKKLPQYAISDGVVTSCGQDTAANGYANYVWVEYPKLGHRLMHYHLDSISVKKGQKVDVNTEIGKTGKTGKATGIHLHLGVKKISGNDWIDPEKFSKDVFEKFLKDQEAAKKPTAATTTNKTSTAKKVEYTKGNYKVNTALLKVRSGAGLKYSRKVFSQLTSDAQKKVKKLNKNKAADGYVMGLEFTATSVVEADGYHWGKTPSGYVALEYCVKI